MSLKTVFYKGEMREIHCQCTTPKRRVPPGFFQDGVYAATCPKCEDYYWYPLTDEEIFDEEEELRIAMEEAHDDEYESDL